MPIQAPNWTEARDFVELITGHADPAITFQVFDDKGERFDIAQWHHGKLSDENIRAWLISKAAEGCGVFFTLNECDGKGRRRENVTRGRVLGVDFDGTPLPADNKFDVTVESSPGKFHGYFLIEPTTDLAKWSDTQAQLAEYYGADPAVFDAPRVFRLPGFYHQKGQPFRTRVLSKIGKDEAQFERANIDDIRMDHPCEYRAPARRTSLQGTIGNFEDNPRDIEFLKGILAKTCPAEGERNNIAYRMACLCNDYGISPERATELLLEWNDDNGVGLPDGEIHHVVNSAATYKNSPAGSKASVDPVEDFAREPIDPGEIKIDGEGLGPIDPKKSDPYKPFRVAELLALPAPKWLVQSLFIEGGLFEIYGKFKSGKTFWAVEISCCIATGHDFFGLPVKQGKVLYIIAEGSRKLFAYRIDAWIKARAGGDKKEYARLRKLIDENIEIVPSAVHINNAEKVRAFLKRNKVGGARALVVVDTFFRNFQGNASEAEPFSKFIEGCDLIRRVLESAVLFLHHEKRNDAQGGFGSVVGEASVDAACRVHAPEAKNKKEMRTSLTPELMRDGELADAWNCTIDVVTIDDPTLTDAEVKTVGTLEFEGRGKDKRKTDDVVQLIHDHEPANVEALAVLLGLSKRATDKRLKPLRDAGHLVPRKLMLTDKGKRLVALPGDDGMDE